MEEEKRVALLREQCEKESQVRLSDALQRQLEQKAEEWREEEEKRLKKVSGKIEECHAAQLHELQAQHTAETAIRLASISQLELKVRELSQHVVVEQIEHKKTKDLLKETRQHFSRFIGEVPGFESDFFTSSPFPQR